MAPVVALVGPLDADVAAILTDVLEELGLSVRPTITRPDPAPAAVLVGVTRDVSSSVGHARALAGGAPIVALLPFKDERLARVALESGADACHAWGAPVRELTDQLLALTGRHAARPAMQLAMRSRGVWPLVLIVVAGVAFTTATIWLADRADDLPASTQRQ